MLDKLLRMLAECEIKDKETKQQMIERSAKYGFDEAAADRLKELSQLYPHQLDCYGRLALEVTEPVERGLTLITSFLRSCSPEIRKLCAINMAAVLHLSADELVQRLEDGKTKEDALNDLN